MKKNEYLKKLEETLNEARVDKLEIKSVIGDYNELYQDLLDNGYNESEIISKLGSPKNVYQSLKRDLTHHFIAKDKIVGVMVFVSIIIFFLIGYLGNAWEYSWIAMLIIPISAIVLNTKGRQMLPGLMVFVSVIIYYVIGIRFDIWHPTWLIFLSIPIAGVLSGKISYQTIIGILPFGLLIIYFLIAYYNQSFYLYGWPIFLLIPIISLLLPPFKRYDILLSLVITLSGIIYLIIGFNLNEWRYSLWIFIIPIILSIFTGHVTFVFDEYKILKNKKIIGMMIITVLIYLIASFSFGRWDITWLILLFIPMIGIYHVYKFNYLVAYMPFVSLILYYIFGIIFQDGFMWSWLFFLSIPIFGIIGNHKFIEVKKNEEDEINEIIE
ncbi:MAG: hypothetical protein WC907_01705 [Acholeplasmataceae bacterium]